jgi:hypothetical protein
MDWMAFSLYLGVVGLVCGIGFWEKLGGFVRRNRSNDSN